MANEINHYIIPNLDRALSVLEELSICPNGLGVSEVAQRVGIPKNSAFRILYTLHQRGYVEQTKEGKLYRLSCRMLSLGHTAVDDSTLLERAIPSLVRLRNLVGETVLLGVMYNEEGVVLEQIPGNNLIRCTIPVGYRFPLYTSAAGKVFLAYAEDSICEKIISNIQFVRYTETTIRNRHELSLALQEIRKNGYGLDRGEQLCELRCIAAPVFDSRSNIIAAIWVNAPSFRITTDDLVLMSDKVISTADEISVNIGWNGKKPFSSE